MDAGISRARALRRAQTEAERVLWSIVRGRRFSGFKFRRQFPIGPYVADFICLEARLIIEADGSQHVENPHDERRDAWLGSQGFRVLRLWNNLILSDRLAAGDAIWAALTGEG